MGGLARLSPHSGRHVQLGACIAYLAQQARCSDQSLWHPILAKHKKGRRSTYRELRRGRYQASLLAVPANLSSCCEKVAGWDQLH
jgi:hypothetical protein